MPNFRERRILSAFLFFALFLCALPLHAESTSVDAADTRVLIDVSGSMKKNDPRNLRRPALRLLVELLPDDSRAGVWTFGRWVNMQVPLGKVDDAWRARARDGAEKIHSRGQFTNIEDVLKRSIEDWDGAARAYDRHMILLTDGVVDISKNPAENAAARNRILNELLPRIKGYGAHIHAIALSERADHELLKQMANETDGWYEQVNDAAQLQRIFLRLFEKVGKPDTIPLKDNRFQVDQSIDEVTLLVFRAEDAAPTRVITPGGAEFGAKDAPKTVRWHRDEGYDLLTISKPEAGEWRVLAAMDPDNRVMVVTDLKMAASDLPSRILQGERLPLRIHFTDQGQKIVKKDFLEVVDLKAEHTDEEGPGEPRPIFDDGKDADEKAGDGDFTLLWGEGVANGKVELVVSAEGKTFVRERRYLLELLPAARLESAQSERDGASGLLVKVVPDSELVDLGSVAIEGALVSKEGESTPVMFLPGEDGLSREGWVDSSKLAGEWSLGVQFKANSREGKALALDLGPVEIKGALEPPPPEPEPAPEPAPEQEPAPEPEPAPVPEPEPEPTPEPAPAPPEEEEGGWFSGIILLLVLNLLIAGAAGGAFWYFRRKKAGKDELQLVEGEEAGGESQGVLESEEVEEEVEEEVGDEAEDRDEEELEAFGPLEEEDETEEKNAD